MNKNPVPGDRVVVCNIPWRGVTGTYVGPKRFLWLRRHVVELGDIISGGSPRRVTVSKIRPATLPHLVATVEVLRPESSRPLVSTS